MTSVTRLLKNAPVVRRVARSTLVRSLKHRLVVARSDRANAFTTAFQRCPNQFRVLMDPVLALLMCGDTKMLNVTQFGCSSGAESYSIASELLRAEPPVDFMVRASDREDWILGIGRAGHYTREQVFKNRLMTDEFFDSTFEPDGDGFRIRAEVSERVTFEQADVLDPDVLVRFEPADIIYAQNFLYHLDPGDAERAFDHIYSLLKPRAALFIDGMDLGLKERLVKRYGLHVVDYLIEEAHEDARAERGAHWPREYWGLEPLSKHRPNWKVRYGQVFTTVAIA